MAFQKLHKPVKSTGTHIPRVTISKPGNNGQTYVSLNSAARKHLGDPTAIHMEWDAERYLLRIVASHPEDPAAYKLPEGTCRIGATAILRELGLIPADTWHMRAQLDTRLSLVVDVSEMPVAGAVRAA